MIEPGYYRYKGKPIKSYDASVNPEDLGYAVWDESSQEISVLINGHHYTYDSLTEFVSKYEFDPDGSKHYHQNILSILSEIEESNVDYKALSQKLIGFNPHISETGDVDSTDLTLADKKPAVMKKRVAEVRNHLSKTKKSLAQKKDKLDLMVEDMKTALEVKSRSLNALVARAEEAIWMINLYLGKDEEIHRLAKGESAPKEEKIRIRQGILYMDEECAAAAEEGGIDVQNIEEFDKWVIQPKNLQRVLPELKGVVAFHIRRTEKEYGDPWTNSALNAANKQNTYFLIRNGENLYRIYAEIVLGSRLFPTDQEYKELFQDSEFDWSTRKYKKKVLRPGSSGYMDALKQVAGKQRHYLRVLLILQGLLDRTAIFRPIPFERVNICNPAEYFEFLEFIRDREKVLGSIMPAFDDWHKDLNSKLEAGHRIIGSFDSYHIGLRADPRDYYAGRLRPQTASNPDSLVLHTIARREEDGFIFLYERKETIYGYYDSHEAKNRASCLIYPRDDFVLNFDLASVEDMEFYIESRLDRHNYISMFPLLKKAIALKKQEKLDEEPFRKLLIAQIILTYKATMDAATSQINDLIYWWKFKNRTHRALTSDDQKALRMIIKEYGACQKRLAERVHIAKFQQTLITTIQAQPEPPIFIAHKKENIYVALVPHNKMNYWVKEQIWVHKRKTNQVVLKEEKEWKLVDNRHKRWAILHTEPRWVEWKINPSKAKVLTDPEIEEAVAWGVAKIKERAAKGRKERATKGRSSNFWPHGRNHDDQEIRDDILKVYLNPEDFRPLIWYCEYGSFLPTELLLSTNIDEPETRFQPIVFERKKKAIQFYLGSDWKGSLRDDHILLTEESKALTKFREEEQAYKALKKEEQKLHDRYYYVGGLVEDYVKEQKEKEAYDEFIVEHGDPDLWEDELKQLKIKIPHQFDIRTVVDLFAERDVDIIGKTLGEVVERAREWGWSEKQDRDTTFDLWPLDFVIPVKEDDEEDEEWDEEED